MSSAPDYKTLSRVKLRTILDAHSVPEAEFWRMTEEYREGVWRDSWNSYQELLKKYGEVSTSASAKRESLETKGSAGQVPSENAPRIKQTSSTEVDNVEDVEELFGEWLDEKNSTESKTKPIEQIFPRLSPKTILQLQSLIKTYEDSISVFFGDRETTAEPDDQLQTNPQPTLTVGFIPSNTNWKLTERLDDGRSGSGEVWLAQNSITDRLGVCKFPKKQRSFDTHKSLINEARLVARLNHPGIATLLEENLSHPKFPFIVFEYSRGKDLAYTLRTLFANKNPSGGATRNLSQFTFEPLPHVEAAAIIERLSDTIAAAHSLTPRSVVHRDLKPENILVTNYYDLLAIRIVGAKPDLRLADFKIIDFGIGGFSTTGRSENTIAKSIARDFDRVRTQQYGSPQQVRGELPNESDDVYALGLIWHELLAGETYAGAPTGRWRERLQESGANEDQVSILEKCLENSRTHRIKNARDLSQQIRTAYALSSENFDPMSIVEELKPIDPREAKIDLAELASLSDVSETGWELVSQLIYQFMYNGKQIQTHIHVGNTLLSDVAALQPEIATVIRRCDFRPDLSGLKALSSENLREISDACDGEFFFDGLESLPVETANALAAVVDGSQLCLSGVKTLPLESAAAIATISVCELHLEGLETVGVELAEILAKSKASEIYLNGICKLSPDVAHQLSSFGGETMFLTGLTELSSEVIKAFGDNDLEICLYSPKLNSDTISALFECEQQKYCFGCSNTHYGEQRFPPYRYKIASVKNAAMSHFIGQAFFYGRFGADEDLDKAIKWLSDAEECGCRRSGLLKKDAQQKRRDSGI